VLRPGGELIVLLPRSGGALEGLRQRWLRRRLAGLGFEQAAGEESEAFLVAHLAGAG
jgi:hypothetical protein